MATRAIVSRKDPLMSRLQGGGWIWGKRPQWRNGMVSGNGNVNERIANNTSIALTNLNVGFLPSGQNGFFRCSLSTKLWRAVPNLPVVDHNQAKSSNVP